ncbi:MAG: hypothetical protein JWO47_463 [Candidatus Saccharibacteria bacterium]|nr:hypothetical protein [Candidatus Saccharibacteria bacterium]
MSKPSRLSPPRGFDSMVQREIADALSVLSYIDLTIPAQRQVANRVRDEFDLPPLASLLGVASIDKAESVEIIMMKEGEI